MGNNPIVKTVNIRRKRVTLKIEIEWDNHNLKYGPAPGLIFAVIDSSPELRGTKVTRWCYDGPNAKLQRRRL